MNKDSLLLIDKLKKLSNTVSEKLWDMALDSPERPRLIFPKYRDGRVRISEQESKTLFTNTLEESHWFYSVETPTAQTYVQSGTTPLSARTDISLYDNANLSSKLVNIELKAHNPHKESFRKDLEKLVREEIHGLWFHTIENCNKRTLPSIFNKITKAFVDIKPYLKGKHRIILFAFCVLDSKETIFKMIAINDFVDKNWAEIQRVFTIDS